MSTMTTGERCGAVVGARRASVRVALVSVLIALSACGGDSGSPTDPCPAGCPTISGQGLLTIVASPSCQGLPSGARERTYPAVVTQSGCASPGVTISVTGTTGSQFVGGFACGSFVLGGSFMDDGYLMIMAAQELSVSGNVISGRFTGQIGTDTQSMCSASDHLFQFVRS